MEAVAAHGRAPFRRARRQRSHLLPGRGGGAGGGIAAAPVPASQGDIRSARVLRKAAVMSERFLDEKRRWRASIAGFAYRRARLIWRQATKTIRRAGAFT